MKKYAAYISGNGTRIKKAIMQYPEIEKSIRCVITDEDNSEINKMFFEGRGIKYYALDFSGLDKSLDRNLVFSDFMLKRLESHNVDYCFSFGAHILKGALLDKYSMKIINFHPAILPDFPGLHAIDKAVEGERRYLGNTVHFIDAGVDTGPIIMQNVMLAENFYREGYDFVLDQQVKMLWHVYRLLELDKIILENGKVKIIGADYSVSNIYPRIMD